MISQTAEYALRAISLLAARHPHPVKTCQIAESARVPRPYLVKVLQALARSGIVKTRRGIGGGVSLTRNLNEVTILDVVSAVDPPRRITACPIGLAAHDVELCAMHARLDEALATMEQTFRETTLAALIADGTPRAGCPFPHVRLRS